MSSFPASPRTIIHVDLDAFYCAVEEQRDPRLCGQAFAVGGRPEARGVVASCSYAARQRGVHSAMSMAYALRLCPGLRVVPVRHSEYRRVSDLVMGHLHRLTPLVEQLSIDEAFLDVTGVLATGGSAAETGQSAPHTGRDLGLTLQRQIRDELGLSCSVGIATNKMVAKIATDYGKAAVGTGQSPQAICVVAPGEEAAFLAPLPVTALWGVGPKTAEQLTALGIQTIGDLAQWPQRDLLRRFGKHGYELSRHAHGIDKREVVTERESKSISSESTFIRDLEAWEPLHAALHEQAQSVASDLAAQKLQGSTVKLKLRWSDLSFSTRQTTLISPTAQSHVIEETAVLLLKQLWQDAQPVRLLGVGISGLSPVRQLSLWDGDASAETSPANASPIETTPLATTKAETAQATASPLPSPEHDQKRQHLEQTMAQLQKRFGPSIVQVARRLEPNS